MNVLTVTEGVLKIFVHAMNTENNLEMPVLDSDSVLDNTYFDTVSKVLKRDEMDITSLVLNFYEFFDDIDMITKKSMDDNDEYDRITVNDTEHDARMALYESISTFVNTGVEETVKETFEETIENDIIMDWFVSKNYSLDHLKVLSDYIVNNYKEFSPEKIKKILT